MANLSLKTGCNSPADKREKQIPLKAILSGGITFPTEFNAEEDVTKQAFGVGRELTGYMWGNDVEGCCVDVAKGNYTRVLEFIEQGFEIKITTQDIHNDYRRQSGGHDEAHDTGLFMGAAMTDWEKVGWDVTGGRAAAKNKAAFPGCWRKKTPVITEKMHLDIFASAEVYTPDDLRACIYALHGCLIAVMLTETDFKQFDAGEPWDLTGNDGEKRSGHCMYALAYKDGNLFRLRTWGKVQVCTERWYEKRQYDARGVADNRDKFLAVSKIDPEKLKAILLDIANN